MIYYLDSSVVVDWLFLENGKSGRIGHSSELHLSVLTRVEVCRALDRHKLRGWLTDEEIAVILHRFATFTGSAKWIPVSASVIEQAMMSFPTFVKSLDAIHIASALLLKKNGKATVTFVTHDRQQGIGAMAMGFDVEGLKTGE